MGIFGDIHEVKSKWKELSPRNRILVILPAFFAISPIASLTETIIKWKGFFATGIDFYKTHIIQPLLDATAWLDLEYTESQSDLIVIGFLVMSGYTRHRLLFLTDMYTAGMKKLSNIKVTVIILKTALGFLLPVLIVGAFLISHSLSILILILVPLVSSFAPVIIHFKRKADEKRIRRHIKEHLENDLIQIPNLGKVTHEQFLALYRGDSKWEYKTALLRMYLPVLIALVVVSVAGAINAAL